ncbi:MAG: PAS domain-containing protein [Erysipelotrichaceae bacterium]|nr:PAS domain-containing protein [Erysipelotrichaceae bacterium]
MDKYFKAIIEAEIVPVVVCDLNHTIIYMNKVAIERYAKRGGEKLIGYCIKDCHNEHSNEMIEKVVEWFKKDVNNNRMFTFHKEKDNKDVYMIALRDDNGKLIGYYEKHEYRTLESVENYRGI